MPAVRIYVIYDSIANSVFPGQVLAPIIDWLNQDESHKAVLISFEKRSINTEALKHAHKRLSIIIAKKLPFIGTLSLHYAAWQLQKILRMYDRYNLIARGPLAGWVCLKIVNNTCDSLTIQARGLLAEEYAYEHSNKKGLTAFMHRIRTYQMRNVEHSAYTSKKTNVSFESVSPALKAYLVETLKADPNKISIAQDDIPKPLNSRKYTKWRQRIRWQLGISDDNTVYCYNGSIKPWQCPELVIEYFKNQRNANSFLLVLTQDKGAFEHLLQHANINQNQYAVFSLPHTEVVNYLAAADIGLLFRQPHIINWVSRPTKLLEYQAAHLEIVHNGTIAWLTDPTMRVQSHKIMDSDCQACS